MVRKEHRQRGKFFLRMKTRYGAQYYRESGVYDVGTEHEEPFLYWTKCIDHAHGFQTMKTARKMAKKLMQEHEINVTIVDREGMVIM